MANEITKRFPANVTLDETVQTFLRDKKVDAELYALLQFYSFPDEEKRTVVKKKDLPKQDEMAQLIGVSSNTTLRTHLRYLIEAGYVVDDKENKQYILPDQEDIFLMIPLDTMQFIKDTVKEQVYKVYIYLGQRWKYKHGYVFTQEEIAAHLGLSLDGNLSARRQINNSLIALQNNGLIGYEQFYEGKVPKHRLVNWSFHHVIRSAEKNDNFTT